MLEIQNLTKHFGPVCAVSDISFRAEGGRILGLLGPNGAGKTTIVRIILDILKASSGKVLHKGKPCSGNAFQNITGYLPEERGLYRKCRVIDVLVYFARLKGLSRSAALSESERLLKLMEISDYRDRNIEELSKGNQQKVQFIASVVHDPEIIIMDEPFSGFDPVNRELLKSFISALSAQNKVIILSTHQMETAEQLCPEIFMINRGKEVLSGNLSHIKANYRKRRFMLRFSGDPAFLKNRIRQLFPALQTTDYTVNGYGNEPESFNNSSGEYSLIMASEDRGPDESELLRKLMQEVNIKEFYRIYPGLNEIFINAIKGEV